MSVQRWLPLTMLALAIAVSSEAGVSYMQNAGQIQNLDSVTLRPSNSTASQAASGGRAIWSNCEGLPQLTIGSTGDVVIDVVHEPAPVSGAGCGLMQRSTVDDQLVGGTIYLYDTASNGADCSSSRNQTAAHEIGHIWGLANSNCDGYLMGPPSPTRALQSDECTAADNAFETTDELFPNDPPGTTPRPTNTDPTCTNPCSPILIDVGGRGFRLTGLEDSVLFDVDADGRLERVSWTDRTARNGFLSLDRNGNGVIDDGAELFGSHTDQPSSDDPNGFLALSVFDQASDGGDQDGRITPRDAIYQDLRLWFDWNHNGRSDRGELLPLSHFAIRALYLETVISNRQDRFGNVFRWAARVDFHRPGGLAAADVVLRHDDGTSGGGPRGTPGRRPLGEVR